jgi:hypothetical protein
MSNETTIPAEEAVDTERFEELEAEDLVISKLEADTLTLTTSAVCSANVRDAQVSTSAIGALMATHDVTVTMSGAGVVAAQGNIALDRSGATAIVAGGDISIAQGGGELILAGGSITMESAGACIVAGREVAIKDGWVGMAIGSNVQIAEGTDVMFGPREAVFVGAAFGALFGLVFALVCGRRRRNDFEE